MLKQLETIRRVLSLKRASICGGSMAQAEYNANSSVSNSKKGHEQQFSTGLSLGKKKDELR